MAVKWNETVVNRSVIRAAEYLAPAVSHFYLGGGTALALRMGHRISLDLDLFSETESLKEFFRARLFTRLNERSSLEIREQSDGTCHIVLENTLVSLFYYPYPLLEGKLDKWRGIRVASLRDIAAMKLSAILGRGTRRDFIDAYFLAKEMGLPAFLSCAKERYKDMPNFPIQVLKALVYFVDAEKEPMPRMKQTISWDTIRSFFNHEVPRLARKMIPRTSTIMK